MLRIISQERALLDRERAQLRSKLGSDTKKLTMQLDAERSRNIQAVNEIERWKKESDRYKNEAEHLRSQMKNSVDKDALMLKVKEKEAIIQDLKAKLRNPLNASNDFKQKESELLSKQAEVTPK